MSKSAKKLSAQYHVQYNFRAIYKANAWANPKSLSGDGATLSATRALRGELPKLLKQLEIKTILDAGCGDFHWMGRAKLGIEQYIGIDIVPELIRKNQRAHGGANRKFLHRDLVS